MWPVTAETYSQISPNCNYYILFDVYCVLTVHNILHKFDNTQRDGLSPPKIRQINVLRPLLLLSCVISFVC